MSISICLSLDFLFNLAFSKLLINQPNHFQLIGNLGMSLSQATSFFLWERRPDTLHKLCPRENFFLATVFQDSLCTGPSRFPWTIPWHKARKLKYHWSRLECILITVCLGCKYIHPVKHSGARKWPQGESMFSLELDKNSIYHLAFHYNGWPQWDLGSLVSL